MLALSAADSVSLAIHRTREFLFRPFSWGTYLKLGLVAIITEDSAYNSGSSHGGGERSHTGPVLPPSMDITAVKVAAIVAAILLTAFIAMWLFYLLTRLRFAFFHCLVYNTKEIRPGWRLYREPATRFFWFNMAAGLCFLLVIAVLSLPFIVGLWRLFREMQQTGHTDIALLLSVVLPMIPLIVLLALAAITIDVVLRDWIMPHFAIDDATAGEAWRAVWARIKAEKRQFLVYTLLRVALPVVAIAVLFTVLLIPGLIVAGSIAALVYAIHSAFASSTGGAAEAGLLVQTFFGSVGFLLMVLLAICLGAPVSTGLREYALMFYGGRYPALGDILTESASQSRPITGTSGMD